MAGAERASAARPLRVLVVDDHELFVTSLRLAMQHTPDIRVTAHAPTLLGAYRAVRTDPPDVVVLDYRLPDGDGIAGSRELRRIRPKLRIVMLTASESETVMAAAVEAGCAGFVTKTAPLDALVTAIRDVAAGNGAVPPQLLGRLLPRPAGRSQVRVGDPLSPRERQILALVAEGMTNRAIARQLTISVFTVRNHITRLSAKLGAHSKLEALVAAVRKGLVETQR